jgi:site-specific DNA-methyltransferase (adenine-specific)/adenine-specific DNA-methyltransferase
MRLPTIECDYLVEKAGDGTVNSVVIRLNTFKSKAMVKGATQKGNRETLSMVMVDYDYDGEGEVFEMDTVFYAGDIEKNGWEFRLPAKQIGQQMMIIYIDVYGNEYKEVKTLVDFQPVVQAVSNQETADA